MADAPESLLLYGDNLAMLPGYVADESVDLVYLDPPFNSNATYNMLFKEQDGSRVAAQFKAFTDTWRWDAGAARTFHEVVDQGGKLADVLVAFRAIVGDSNMLAYLSMMAPRLHELRRALKPTGSIYLHCDPTASHYLKVLMDAVFGAEHFRSEIVWKRSSAHSDGKQGRRQHGRIHDVLLFYTKSDEWTWNVLYTPYDQAYVASIYKHIEPGTGRRFGSFDITGPGGLAKGNPQYEVLGVTRYWRFSKERMSQLIQDGRVFQPSPGAVPREKRYLDEMPGVPLQDVWTDISPIGAQAEERLGYPTQKPEALLERIIETSTNRGDTVLDPFCGCGTAVSAAERLERRWIGIDITHLAIELIRKRLYDAHGGRARYREEGAPANAAEAIHLARESPQAFEQWALKLVHAQPSGSRGSDRGIDGWLRFRDGRSTKHQRIVISVKSGHVQVSHLRDLRGVMAREDAAIGVLLSLEPPTRAMKQEAASSGFFQTAWGKHPRLQLLTIEEFFSGKSIDYPTTAGADVTFKKAPRAKPLPRAVEQDLFPNALAGTALSRQQKAESLVAEQPAQAYNAARASKQKLAAATQPSIKAARRRTKTVKRKDG
jgi:DNA modification methylase